MSADPKPLTAFQLLMKGLHDKTGPIPDGKAQGAAAKWLVENYTVEESLAFLDYLLEDPKRDHRISLLTVRSGIGTWAARRKPKEVQVSERGEYMDAAERDALTEQIQSYVDERCKFKNQFDLIDQWIREST